MKQLLAIAVFGCGLGLHANAQNPNYSEDIAPIIYDHCSGCHHNGGIAPFALMSYADVAGYGPSISYQVSNGLMPPWPMDTMQPGFVHERRLASTQIQNIVDWVSNGTPEGDPNLAPNPPTFNSNYVLGTPDLQLAAPHYTSKAIINDDYVCFTVPNPGATDKWIEAIEVVAGNQEIVHHCLVYIDEDQSYNADTTSGSCGGPSGELLLGEYTPGTDPIVYPNDGTTKFGVKLKAGSQLVLAMHYPEGSSGQKDSTKVNLHFYPDGATGIREVAANSILSDWGFCIDANDVDTVTAQYPPAGGLPGYVSVLAVFPHMHLLGQVIKTWAITPSNDSIPLGSISHWDFEWQGFYVYKKLRVLPTGSVIYGMAVYDNTTGNPHNPNSPPQQICAGLNTSDEMFLVYFQYLAYQLGDENIDIDAILDPDVTGLGEDREMTKLSISPNPVRNGEDISLIIPPMGNYDLTILNMGGQVVHQESVFGMGQLHAIPNVFSEGVYIVSVRNEQRQFRGKVVVVE